MFHGLFIASRGHFLSGTCTAVYTQLAFVMYLHASVFLSKLNSKTLCEYKDCILFNWVVLVHSTRTQSPDPLLLEL